MPVDERDLAAGIVEKVLKASAAPEAEVSVQGGTEALTRFAGSAIHQNLSRRQLWVSVRACEKGRSGRAGSSLVDGESLARLAARALEVARASQPDPDLPPVAEPTGITGLQRYDSDTAAFSPQERSAAVSEVCRVATEAAGTAAGAYRSGSEFLCIGNSRGHLAYGEHTFASLSATVTLDGSTGFTESGSHSASAIDPAFVGRRAASKAVRGRPPGELPPGRYTAILEPIAVADLMYHLLFGHGVSHWSALGVSEGQSFLADRIGKKVFGENVTLRDDPWHPMQYGFPFDAEGVARRPLTLVEKGVVKEVTCDRATALKLGREPTGHGLPLPNPWGSAPSNIVLEGGDVPIERMIAGAERAILVSRLWYIRLVDPAALIVTGLTRDGTFLVENGRIVRGLRNFRINQSLLEMLNRVTAASAPVRAAEHVVPALTVENFNFSAVVPGEP